MVVLEIACYVVALILLLIAAGSWVDSRWNLGWLGLAFFVLGVVLPRLGLVV